MDEMCSKQYLMCGKAQEMLLAFVVAVKRGTRIVSSLGLHAGSRQTYLLRMEP